MRAIIRCSDPSHRLRSVGILHMRRAFGEGRRRAHILSRSRGARPVPPVPAPAPAAPPSRSGGSVSGAMIATRCPFGSGGWPTKVPLPCRPPDQPLGLQSVERPDALRGGSRQTARRDRARSAAARRRRPRPDGSSRGCGSARRRRCRFLEARGARDPLKSNQSCIGSNHWTIGSVIAMVKRFPSPLWLGTDPPGAVA